VGVANAYRRIGHADGKTVIVAISSADLRPGQLGAQGRDLGDGGPDVGAGRLLSLRVESAMYGADGEPLDRGERALRPELEQMTVDLDCGGHDGSFARAVM
jgi:hypothetical protein